MSKSVTRCKWAEGVSLDYITYHDEEWGVPVRDDRVQFEFLILEGAQAGLSWSTILNKRDGYRKAFADRRTESRNMTDSWCLSIGDNSFNVFYLLEKKKKTWW